MTKILRIEALLILFICIAGYHALDISWIWFLLILAPDASMIGYLKNPKLGAIIYNLGHSYIGPIILLMAGSYFPGKTLLGLAIIWAAHISLDRALGFGLKHSTGFKDTHLGRI